MGSPAGAEDLEEFEDKSPVALDPSPDELLAHKMAAVREQLARSRAIQEAAAAAERAKLDAVDGRMQCARCMRRFHPRVAVRHAQMCERAKTPHRLPALTARMSTVPFDAIL